MCGIFCVYDPRGVDQNPEKYLRAMRTMRHRGPDAEGYHLDGKIFLGHLRLTILDLTESGNQPMFSRDGEVALSYNGEIYNYLELKDRFAGEKFPFRSTSDTEVALEVYAKLGMRAFEEFRGMWAMALWHPRESRLVLSRDRLGIKPLYYHRRGAEWIISSEIKAISAYLGKPPDANPSAVIRYVARGRMDDTDETFFAGVRTFEPGSCMIIEGNGSKNVAFWHPRVTEQPTGSVEDFRGKFLEAMRIHMRSDVPVAMALSGGLDSTSIACAISRGLGMGENIHAFTVSPPETESESFWIDATVRHCGIRHTYIDPKKDLDHDGLLRKTIRMHDEPPFSASQFYQALLKEEVAARGFKVMFVGEAADEILGGYAKLAPIHLAALARAGRYRELAEALRGFPGFTHRSAFALARSAWKVLTTGEGLRNHQVNRFGYELLSREYAADDAVHFREVSHPGLEGITASRGLVFFRELFDRLRIDIRNILKMEDRDGMACSLEIRPPFLDHELIETAFSIDFASFMKAGRNKWIMREALKDLLTPEVLAERTKRVRPGNNVLLVYGILAARIENFLAGEAFRSSRLWNPTGAAEKFRRDRESRNPDSAFVWLRLYLAHLWDEEVAGGALGRL